jgi:hypothetical protein
MTSLWFREDTFGILVDISLKIPSITLVPPRPGLELDGWEIRWKDGSFVVRELRDLGLQVNGKRVSSLYLVENDRLVVDGRTYIWKDFEHPKE